jgi:hypothetical protein
MHVSPSDVFPFRILTILFYEYAVSSVSAACTGYSILHLLTITTQGNEHKGPLSLVPLCVLGKGRIHNLGNPNHSITILASCLTLFHFSITVRHIGHYTGNKRVSYCSLQPWLETFPVLKASAQLLPK